MAWILHAVDDAARRALTRQALTAHHVDEADGLEEARLRLEDEPPYDLALVDLDAGGPELLQLLRSRHPDTRRLVVAAAGSAVVEKYGVEELLLVSELAVPTLRRAVQEALVQQVAGDARIRRAELWRRFQDWRRRQIADLDAKVRTAELYAANSGSARAEAARTEALRARAAFLADADNLALRITRATTITDTLDAAEAFDLAAELY